MHPEFLKIGPIQIYWYGIFMALAAIAGLLNWTWLGKGTKRNFNFCSDMLFWIMLAAILGARIAYIIANLQYFIDYPAQIVRIDQGGLIFYGGLIGASISLILFAKHKGEKILDIQDLAITSIPLGHALGRIGCFINGCCYGSIHSGPLAVTYPKGSLAWDHQMETGLLTSVSTHCQPVHPVQLYEAALGTITFVILHIIYKRHKKSGTVLAAYLLTYPIVRFILEFFRGDPRVRYETQFSVAQYISVTLFCLGCAIFLYQYIENKKAVAKTKKRNN
ncbi:MAG: prolipoprotein diacylglyceryl transferase [Kiritimatiellae bacterium]|nr:prolipoprotein diacylglyceryl transferase [Kiritimatiellia bacterium]